MRDLTVGVFEHFDIKSLMYIYQMVAYTQCILRGALLLKYTTVLVECKHSPKELVGDKWDLVALKGLSTDDLWGWAKKCGIGYYGDAYLGFDKCVKFEKEIWFELGKCMWTKHQSVYHDHLK